jgi:hypothetical protein
VRVFISWSGDTSLKVAKALDAWLPTVLYSVESFISPGIDAGATWLQEVRGKLEVSDFGVLCLTPDNINAPWLVFEAGALSKRVDMSRVVPLMLAVVPSDLLKSPLSQFQGKLPDQDGIWQLVCSLNKTGDQFEEIRIRPSFDKLWPELEAELAPILDEAATTRGKPSTQETQLSADDRTVLEEILREVRSLQRTADGQEVQIDSRQRLLDEMIVVFQDEPQAELRAVIWMPPDGMEIRFMGQSPSEVTMRAIQALAKRRGITKIAYAVHTGG